MYQKFVMGMPHARQEKDWYRLGLVLSRGDMANWSIRCCEEWLLPIYNRIYEQLLECQVLHMDETRIQCNMEAGKKVSSESFMWVMRSAECETITDAYSGYGTVEDITNVLCRAHCRRYYIESIPLDKNGKRSPDPRGRKAGNISTVCSW